MSNQRENKGTDDDTFCLNLESDEPKIIKVILHSQSSKKKKKAYCFDA